MTSMVFFSHLIHLTCS